MSKESIQALVRNDLVHREQLGRRRYGTSLFAHNGRNSILDAYEEALDLCCYLRQAIEEQGIDPQAINPMPRIGQDPAPSSDWFGAKP